MECAGAKLFVTFALGCPAAFRLFSCGFELLNAPLHGIQLLLNGRRYLLIGIARRWYRGLCPLPVGGDWDGNQRYADQKQCGRAMMYERNSAICRSRWRETGGPWPNLTSVADNLRTTGALLDFRAGREHSSKNTTKNATLKVATTRKRALIDLPSAHCSHVPPAN